MQGFCSPDDALFPRHGEKVLQYTQFHGVTFVLSYVYSWRLTGVNSAQPVGMLPVIVTVTIRSHSDPASGSLPEKFIPTSADPVYHIQQ